MGSVVMNAVKALFYLEGKHVQHRAIRLTVTRQLVHNGFTKGGAFNLPDGRVEVVLEEEKGKVIQMHEEIKENLAKWIEKDSLQREALKEIAANPHLDIRVGELEFNDEILVLDIGLFSHTLTFDQIYKGVDVYQTLAEAITNLNKTLEKNRR